MSKGKSFNLVFMFFLLVLVIQNATKNLLECQFRKKNPFQRSQNSGRCTFESDVFKKAYHLQELILSTQSECIFPCCIQSYKQPIEIYTAFLEVVFLPNFLYMHVYIIFFNILNNNSFILFTDFKQTNLWGNQLLSHSVYCFLINATNFLDYSFITCFFLMSNSKGSNLNKL